MYNFQQQMKPLQWATIPDEYAAGGFDSFDQSAQKNAFDIVLEWSKTLTGWVFLFGDVGTGKTHLSAAAIRIALQQIKTAALLSVPSLIAALRPNKKNDPAAVMDLLKSIDVLGIDDLGAQRNTEWVTEQIFTLIDYRAMHKLPTIITSNQDIDELEEFPGWDRIGDRIVEQSAMVKMKPGSYRRIIAKENQLSLSEK